MVRLRYTWLGVINIIMLLRNYWKQIVIAVFFKLMVTPVYKQNNQTVNGIHVRGDGKLCVQSPNE